MLQTQLTTANDDRKTDNTVPAYSEYDAESTFYSIDYRHAVVVLFLGLAAGFIIAICIGNYDAVLITGVSVSFAYLIWSETFGSKVLVKIEGELKDQLNDPLKRPDETEFYLRSDFVDRYERPRGSTMVYVLKDAPGALIVHTHRMHRLLNYKGFEVGAGIAALIFLIISIIISVAWLDTLNGVFLVIGSTFFGSLLGATIEMELRKRRVLYPTNIAATQIVSIPFYAIGNVETRSVGVNQAIGSIPPDQIATRFVFFCFRVLRFIYACVIHIFPLLFSNCFLTLWVFVTVVLGFLFAAHVNKEQDHMIPAFIIGWVTVVYSLMIAYYLTNKIKVGRIPQLQEDRVPNAEDRQNFSKASWVILILITVAAAAITYVTFDLYKASGKIGSSTWKRLNCKDGGSDGVEAFKPKGHDICAKKNFAGMVGAIVILCVTWIALILLAIKFQMAYKKPAVPPEQLGMADFQGIGYQWKWRLYAEVVLHRRKSFGFGQFIWKWIDLLTLKIWNFHDNSLSFPYDIELTNTDAQELHLYLIKKLTYYRELNEDPEEDTRKFRQQKN